LTKDSRTRRPLKTVKIEYLADHAGAIPTLAQWHHDQWQTITPHLTVADRIAGFRSRMRRLDVPTGFVAVLDDVVAGMACLVAHDMEERPELTPWLATVLVGPDYRGRGIGSALSERVVAEGRALAFPKLYLVTFDKARFYARLGWNNLEQTEFLGLPATIMVRLPGV
jgi:GNAT superfamily N-acetyltransferase